MQGEASNPHIMCMTLESFPFPRGHSAKWRTDSSHRWNWKRLPRHRVVTGQYFMKVKNNLLIIKCYLLFEIRFILLHFKKHIFNKIMYGSCMVKYGCESWTTKRAKCKRIDAFELWCWWRLLRVPWTARRSNQSILREIGPGCSLEGLMLMLKL